MWLDKQREAQCILKYTFQHSHIYAYHIQITAEQTDARIYNIVNKIKKKTKEKIK